MNSRWRELLPGDVEDTLEFLRDEALELARHFRALRPVVPFDIVGVQDRTRHFFSRVRSKDDILTVARGTRILRHGTRIVPAIDNVGLESDLEAAIAWLDRVVENIESELDLIDRKRILWLTVASAVLSALAVVIGVGAVIISVFVQA